MRAPMRGTRYIAPPMATHIAGQIARGRNADAAASDGLFIESANALMAPAAPTDDRIAIFFLFEPVLHAMHIVIQSSCECIII